MKMMKRFRLIVLLVVVLSLALVESAAAAENEYLPESSYYDGHVYYSDDLGELARIEFAVYDTETYPDEFTGDGYDVLLSWWDDAMADNCRYIYAYQLFLDEHAGDVTIDYFGVVGIGDGALVQDESTNNEWPIACIDDFSGEGIDPEDDGTQTSTTNTKYGEDVPHGMVVWEFTNGALVAGEHSWFFVIGSDNPWTIGAPTFNKYDADGIPGIIPSNPEPGTLALLCFGGAITMLMKRRKACRPQ